MAAAYTECNNKGATMPATQDLTNLANCIASISGGSSPVIDSLSITPTTSSQTITAPSGTDGYNPINVSAVTSSIDSNITANNIKKDISILGVTGTYEGSGGGSGTTDVPLTRISDDNNNEIGTWYMNFEDANGNVFKVVLLDAQYRSVSTQWCSSNSSITNMPIYSDISSSNVWESKETATSNTQLILDYCAANDKTSSACSHCRNQSFIINGTTYYGQLPNLLEVSYLAQHYNEFDALDISASLSTTTNFSTHHGIWTSSQSGITSCWRLTTGGAFGFDSKNSSMYFTSPILEIPVSNS